MKPFSACQRSATTQWAQHDSVVGMNANEQHMTLGARAIVRWALVGVWALGVLVVATGPDATDGRLDWVAAGAHVSVSIVLSFLLANALWQHTTPRRACGGALAGAMLFIAGVEVMRFQLLGFASTSTLFVLDSVGALAGVTLASRLEPCARQLENLLRS